MNSHILANSGLLLDKSFFWPSSVQLFGETVSFSDFVSTILLFGCGCLSLLIYLKRQSAGAPGAIIWGVMALGLMFLAQDEFFSFHENFDKWIHGLTGMKQTAWTTQIDTLVLLSYVAVAIICVWRCHREIRDCCPKWGRFLIFGLSVAVTSMICDGLANFRRSYDAVFGAWGNSVYLMVIEVENLCELGAEALFMMFFLSALRHISANAPVKSQDRL